MVYGRPYIYISRAINFISLALIRYIADLAPQLLPREFAYLADHGIKAVKGAFGSRPTYQAFDFNFPEVWIWSLAAG